MRILALRDEINNELTAFTIIEVSYDLEESGIGLLSTDNIYYYIPNVSQSDCNDVCRELAINGYCDVTRFGAIQEYED